MDLYNILKSAHSGWRYLVFALLLIAFVNALMGLMGNKPYTEGSRKINVFALIATHVQVLFGLILYFLSPLVEAGIRYWKMEHIAMMILAAIFITIGNSKSKKGATDKDKFKSIVVFFGIGILVILIAMFGMIYADPSRSFFGIS